MGLLSLLKQFATDSAPRLQNRDSWHWDLLGKLDAAPACLGTEAFSRAAAEVLCQVMAAAWSASGSASAEMAFMTLADISSFSSASLGPAEQQVLVLVEVMSRRKIFFSHIPLKS